MDLKFSLGGASPDHHDHGGAPSRIPLPFAGVASLPTSSSSELNIVVRLDVAPGVAAEPLVVAEVITGDGVTYSRSDVSIASGVDQDPALLSKAVRSAISRAVAALEGPLATSVTAIELQLASAGAGVVAALGLAEASPEVSEELQSRIGVNVGTPIRLA